MTTPAARKSKHITARERVLTTLRDPQYATQGISKSKLREVLDVNAGVFRRLIQSMEDKGEIVVVEEHVPDWGETKFVRLPEAA